MEIPNEAILNQFKFPIDKELPEEVAALRKEVALRMLSSVPYDKMLAARGNNRELAVKAAFAWADAFLAYCGHEAHEAAEEVLEMD